MFNAWASLARVNDLCVVLRRFMILFSILVDYITGGISFHFELIDGLNGRMF